MPWSAAGHRPSWRLGAGKTLCLRYGAPTFYPEDRPGTGRVGAPVPAKPCISVTRRQHFALRRLCPSAKLAPQCRQSLVPPLRGANILPWSAARPPAELAPHCRQSLVPPLRSANILPWSAAGHRPSWRPITGKALCLRYEAPTFCPGARPGHRQSWRPFAGKTLCLRYRTPTSCPGPAAGRQKTIKKRATSVARPWCAIRGSNPGHPD